MDCWGSQHLKKALEFMMSALLDLFLGSFVMPYIQLLPILGVWAGCEGP